MSLGPRGSTNGDHQLDPLTEGPEGENDSDSETETLSTEPRVRRYSISYGIFLLCFTFNSFKIRTQRVSYMLNVLCLFDILIK